MRAVSSISAMTDAIAADRGPLESRRVRWVGLVTLAPPGERSAG
jgi:hypothetical protein